MEMTHDAMFPMDAFKGFVTCWDVADGNFLVLILFYIFDGELVDPDFVGVWQKTPNWGNENLNS